MSQPGAAFVTFARALLILFVIAIAGTFAVGQTENPPNALQGPPERIRPCTVDVILTIPGSQRKCFLGENRIGPFCPAGSPRIPRCSDDDLSYLENQDGRVVELTFGAVRRIASGGTAQR